MKKSRRHLVICVDDDPAVLRALRRALRAEPYELVTTTDPQRALLWVCTRDISLLVADERMPELGGVQLLERVRAHSPGTIRVMLTGYPDMEVIAERVRLGIRRLITKPWNDQELRAMIRQLLAEREAA